ncbi:MAG: SIMPL domain-containing protein [Alphaproteobacteria bacterium]
MKKHLLALAVALSPLAFAHAQEGRIPEDATVVNLTATAKQKMTPDTLTATLNIEYKADNAEDVQRYINQKMAAAVKRAEQNKAIKIVTGQYSVYQHWVDPQQLVKGTRQQIWQGQQQVTFSTTTDHPTLLKTVADIQGMGFATHGLNYSLSEQVAESFNDNLMAQAVSDLKRKAERIAGLLGKRKVHIASLDTQGGYQPMPMYARAMKADMVMAASAEAMPEPTTRPDETEVQVTVSAQVWLRD